MGPFKQLLEDILLREMDPLEEDPRPLDLFHEVGKDYIGQEEARLALCTAAVHHYRSHFFENDDTYKGNNIILVGPTGSGKTHLANRVTQILGVPSVEVDATSFTEEGYVGESVQSILTRLYREAKGDLEVLHKGIVHFKETDKLADTSSDRGEQNVSRKPVQQALLKLTDGKNMSIPHPDKKKSGEYLHIDTSKLLFIFDGAFVGIDEVVTERMKTKAPIGFGGSSGEEKPYEFRYAHITHEDLITYGMIPEFVGRAAVIAKLEELSEDELLWIVEHGENSPFRTSQNAMKLYDKKLYFDPSCYKYVVENLPKGVGARGLSSLRNTLLQFEGRFASLNAKEIGVKVGMLEDPKQFLDSLDKKIGGWKPREKTWVWNPEVRKGDFSYELDPKKESYGFSIEFLVGSSETGLTMAKVSYHPEKEGLTLFMKYVDRDGRKMEGTVDPETYVLQNMKVDGNNASVKQKKDFHDCMQYCRNVLRIGDFVETFEEAVKTQETTSKEAQESQ